MITATTRVYVCTHVLSGAPILCVYYDAGRDAHVGVSCGTEEHAPGMASVYAWGCLLNERPELRDLDLRPDTYYHRDAPGQAWLVGPLPAEDEAA